MIKYVYEKPFSVTTIEGATKDHLVGRIASSLQAYMTFGSSRVPGYPRSSISGLMDRRQEFLYLIHYEKRRLKTSQRKVKSDLKGSTQKYTISNIVREPKWIARIYKFNLKNVISAKQNTRNFEITLLK